MAGGHWFDGLAAGAGAGRAGAGWLQHVMEQAALAAALNHYAIKACAGQTDMRAT